jgi:hypothetical protein
MTVCTACYGSGELLGVGMINIDCHHCDGKGKKEKIEIDKQSKSYKTAVKKIKALNSDISDDKAHEIFEDEFNKIAS